MNKKNCCLYLPLSIGLIVMLLMSFPFAMGLIFKDGDWIEDPTLKLNARVIPETENAYFNLIGLNELQISDEDNEKVEAHLKGEAWDSSFVETLFATHEENLEIFASAARMPYFQDPDLSNPDQATIVDSIPELTIMDTVRLSNLKALAFVKAGNEEAAFEQAFLSIELGQKMEESYGTLINYLIAKTTQQIGLETVLLISREATNTEIVNNSTAKLSNYLPDTARLAQAYIVGYQVFQEAFDIVENDRSELSAIGDNRLSDEETAVVDILLMVGSSYYYHPNDTRTLNTLHFKEKIEKIQTFECGTEVDETEKKYEAYSQPFSFRFFFTENAIGLMLLDTITPLLITEERFCTNEVLIKQILEVN